MVNNNNKDKCAKLAYLLASLLVMAATDGHLCSQLDHSGPGPAGEATEIVLQNYTTEATDSTKKEEKQEQLKGPDSLPDNSSTSLEGLTGESRSTGGTETRVFPWLTTMHSSKTLCADGRFCGMGIFISAGLMIVHARTLVWVAHHESEIGRKALRRHFLQLLSPADAIFDVNTEDRGEPLLYDVVASQNSFFLLRTSQEFETDRYPSPSQYPTIASLREDPKEDCFLYSWSGESDCDERNSQRKFVKMPVKVLDCCADTCRLQIALPLGLCYGRADLGSPILCKEKLGYLVSNIRQSRLSAQIFDAIKIARLTGFFGPQSANKLETAKHRPIRPNRKLTGVKKQLTSGARMVKQQPKHKKGT